MLALIVSHDYSNYWQCKFFETVLVTIQLQLNNGIKIITLIGVGALGSVDCVRTRTPQRWKTSAV